MELSQVTLGAVLPEEEARFRAVMGTHHYLGAAPKVGETLLRIVANSFEAPFPRQRSCFARTSTSVRCKRC